MKKYKNAIIAAVVVILGVFTCAIALNEGQAPPQGQDGNGEYDSQEQQGMQDLEKNPLAGQKVEFTAKDISGNDIDNSVFKNHDLTIINLWSPFCGPCVEEMPDLQKIQDEYKDKVKVIGLLSKMDEKDAPETLKSKNITYTNIVANKDLESIVNSFDYIPVTLFVDSEGKILDTFIPGGADFEMFKQKVEELAKQ